MTFTQFWRHTSDGAFLAVLGAGFEQGMPVIRWPRVRGRNLLRCTWFGGGAVGVALLMSGCAPSGSDESSPTAASGTAQVDVLATTAGMSPPFDECRLVARSVEYDYEPGAGGGEPTPRDAVKRFVKDHAGGLPAGRDGALESPNGALESGTWRRVTPEGELAAIFRVEPYALDEFYVTGFNECVVGGR